jgi:hypothetical protein
MEFLIILGLIMIFFVLPAFSCFRNISYEYQGKPVRRFLSYTIAITLFPVVMPYYAICWVLDIDDIRSMPAYKGYYYSSSDDDYSDGGDDGGGDGGD